MRVTGKGACLLSSITGEAGVSSITAFFVSEDLSLLSLESSESDNSGLGVAVEGPKGLAKKESRPKTEELCNPNTGERLISATLLPPSRGFSIESIDGTTDSSLHAAVRELSFFTLSPVDFSRSV